MEEYSNNKNTNTDDNNNNNETYQVNAIRSSENNDKDNREHKKDKEVEEEKEDKDENSIGNETEELKEYSDYDNKDSQEYGQEKSSEEYMESSQEYLEDNKNKEYDKVRKSNKGKKYKKYKKYDYEDDYRVSDESLDNSPNRMKSEETLSSEQSIESGSKEGGSKRSRRTAAINQRLLMKKIASHEPVVEAPETPIVQKPKRKKEYRRTHLITKTDIDTFNIVLGSTMVRNTGYILPPNLQNKEQYEYNTQQNIVNTNLSDPNSSMSSLSNTNYPNSGLAIPGLPNANLPNNLNSQILYNLNSQNAPNPYYYNTSSDPSHAYSTSYIPPLVKNEDGYKMSLGQKMTYFTSQGSGNKHDKDKNKEKQENTIISMIQRMGKNSKVEDKEAEKLKEDKEYNNQEDQNQDSKEYTEEYLDYDNKDQGETITKEQLKNPGVIYNFNEIDNIFIKKKKKVLVNMDHLFIKGLKYIKEYMENNLKTFTGDLMVLRNMGLDNYFVDPEYFLQTGGNYSQLKDDVDEANKLIESLQMELNELHTKMGKTQLAKINEPSVQCCSSTYSMVNKDNREHKKDKEDKTLEYEEILEEMKDFQDLVNDEHREKRKLFKNLILGTSKYIHKMEMELNKSKSEKNKHILILYKNISNMIELFWKKIEKFAWEHLKKDLQQELIKKKKENLDKFIQDAIKVSINDQDRYIFKQKMKNTTNISNRDNRDNKELDKDNNENKEKLDKIEKKNKETQNKDRKLKEVALDEDDYEITLGEEDEKMEVEDLKLEEEMESDKEEGELDALQKDLEMPIEELIKMYQQQNMDEGYEELGEEGESQEFSDEEEYNKDNREHKKDKEDKTETYNNDKHGIITHKRQMTTKREPMKKETEGSESDDGGVEEVVVKNIGKVKTPFLIRGVLRPYQKEGLGWLVSLYQRGINGVLADEMGLGKTLQAISLLAYLACVEGNWGPHIIVVPTSILLNWVMEFNKFCPGFKVLAYYGSQTERARKRSGWNRPHSFNVLIASYSTVVQDAYVLKRRVWEYMILDEAQNIKNFHSKRWQTLLTFNTKYRLLLTGTPLQNSLQELWSLMHFILPNIFTSHTQFNIWFTDPLNQALDNMYSNNPLYKDNKDKLNEEKEEMNRNNMELVEKLHVIFRPYLLRRLKKDVEKQMPSKYEHVLKCTLTRRQQVLYDEYINLYNLNNIKGGQKEVLSYKSMLNILMQLRKICNHPNQLRSRDVEIPIEFNINTVQLSSFFNISNCSTKTDFRNYTKLNLFNGIYNDKNNREHKKDKEVEEEKEDKEYNDNKESKETKKEEKEHASSYFTRHQQGHRSISNRYGQYSNKYYYYDYSDNDSKENTGSNRDNKDSNNDKEYKYYNNYKTTNEQSEDGDTNYKSTLQFPRKYKDRLVLDSRIKKRKLNTSFGVQFLLQAAETMNYDDENDNHNYNSNAQNSPKYNRNYDNNNKHTNNVNNMNYNNSKEYNGNMNNNNKYNSHNYYGSVEDKLMVEKTVCEQLLKKENSILNLNLGNKLEVNKVVECYLSLVLNFLFMSDKVVSRPVRLYFSGESGVNFNNRQEWYMKEIKTKLFKRDNKEYFKKNLVTIEGINSQYRLLFPSKRSLNDDCGKFRVLGPLLLKLRSEGHRCIVYTQFSKMLDILENWINFMGFTYTRLDGSTKVELRQKIINRFNENTKIFLFISSTRTGGVGITLTGADTVIFYDTDWNPAIDRQAMDRCHRIGQTKDVNVYRLISEHTVEENIWRKQLQKRKLDDLIVDQGQFDVQHNNWFSNIDTLINIFQHKGDGEDDEEIYGRKILHESAVDETQVKPTGVQSLKLLIEVEDVDDSMALKKLTKENEKINKQDFENDIINSIPGLVTYCIKFLLKYQTVSLVKQVETMKLKIQIEDYQKNQKEEEEEDEDDIYTDYTSSEGEEGEIDEEESE